MTTTGPSASNRTSTFCRICEYRCGITVTTEGGRPVRVAPDKENPHTWHDFCVKGRTSPELANHPLRITSPMRRVGDGYELATWDEALDDIAGRCAALIAEDGPDAIAVFTGNPANYSGAGPIASAAFMSAIGSGSSYNDASLDHNSKLVAGLAMFGDPSVRLVPDVDEADFFLFVGMNPADSGMFWGGAIIQGWKRVLAAQERGATLVVVDPRRTPTAERADEYLAIRPGTDWAFLLALLKVILDEGLEDREACAESVGIEQLRELVAEADLHDLADRAGLEADVIADLARRFARARTGFCDAHTGVSISRNGGIGIWLDYTLNAVTGRLDCPGGRRYQPSVADFSTIGRHFAPPVGHRSRIMGLPMIAGAHSAAEIAAEVLTPGQGRIRAMILHGANPVVNGPAGARLDEAFGQLDLLVSLDLVQRESHRNSHWLLPMTHFLEREDLLLGIPEERPYIQFGRRAAQPPELARDDWWFFVHLADRMGYRLFGLGVDFTPEYLYEAALDAGPLAWSQVRDAEHGLLYAKRTFGHLRHALRTPDRRIHLAPTEYLAEARRVLSSSEHVAPAQYPLSLISRRHASTMNSFTNDLPTITKRIPANSLEMSRHDAYRLGFTDGDRAMLRSSSGAVEVVLTVTDNPRPGVVVSEHGWGSRVFDTTGQLAPSVRGFNRNVVVSDRDIDRLTQVPLLNATWVAVEKVKTPGERVPG